MRSKVIMAALVVLFHTHISFGQTAADVEMRYGKPETVYSVSEHLWMTPAYAADGQVCLMRFYPKSIAPRVNYLNDWLDMDEVLMIINELIPLKARGSRKDSFGMSSTGGGAVWTNFEYDRVTFTFSSSFRLDKSLDFPSGEFSLLDRPSDLDKLSDVDEKAVEEARQKEVMRPDDELIRERTAKPKVLQVSWTGRECVGP